MLNFGSRARGRIAAAAMTIGAMAVVGTGGATRAEAGDAWNSTFRLSAGFDAKYDSAMSGAMSSSAMSAAKPYYPQKKTYSASTKRKKKSSGGVKVAALTSGDHHLQPKKPQITGGGGVKWVASSGCLAASLKSVIYQGAASFGPVTVNSTCRSKGRNAAVGGARRSKHLSGEAADFRVRGNIGAVHAFLRSSGSVGGLKHYGGGLFHIDNGQRRSW